MDPVLLILLALGGAVALSVISFIVLYNGLVTLKNQAKNAWAQIDVQLKRRHDLIPNLVNTVKGYAEHEQTTLENVIKARGQAAGAQGTNDQIQAEQNLSGALGRLMLVVEQYPDLQANENFMSLQEELTSTENKLGFARQLYNDQVLFYKNKLETFPANMVAAFFQFQPEPYFELENQQERQAPEVAF